MNKCFMLVKFCFTPFKFSLNLLVFLIVTMRIVSLTELPPRLTLRSLCGLRKGGGAGDDDDDAAVPRGDVIQPTE